VKYLTKPGESDTFHKDWNIYAPKNILSYLEQGNNELIRDMAFHQFVLVIVE